MKDAIWNRRHFELVSDVINNLNLDFDQRMHIAVQFSLAFNRVGASVNHGVFLAACTKRLGRVSQHVAHRASDDVARGLTKPAAVAIEKREPLHSPSGWPGTDMGET